MAIFVYNTTSGELFSYSPNDSDPVASTSVLAAADLTAVSGLHAIDNTHAWDPGTRTVIVVAAPMSIVPLKTFWQRFTMSEREGIENLLATGTQLAKNKIAAFRTYVQSAGMVDCNDPYILASVQALETAGVLATGRTAQIVV